MFLMAVNGSILYIDGIVGIPQIVTPYDTSIEVEGVTAPNIVDPQGLDNSTAVAQITRNVEDSTGTPWDFIVQNVEFAAQVTWNVIQLLTGGFVWDAIAMFGLPSAFVMAMQGIIGFFLMITIVHFVTGRF